MDPNHNNIKGETDKMSPDVLREMLTWRHFKNNTNYRKLSRYYCGAEACICDHIYPSWNHNSQSVLPAKIC